MRFWILAGILLSLPAKSQNTLPPDHSLETPIGKSAHSEELLKSLVIQEHGALYQMFPSGPVDMQKKCMEWLLGSSARRTLFLEYSATARDFHHIYASDFLAGKVPYHGEALEKQRAVAEAANDFIKCEQVDAYINYKDTTLFGFPSRELHLSTHCLPRPRHNQEIIEAGIECTRKQHMQARARWAKDEKKILEINRWFAEQKEPCEKTQLESHRIMSGFKGPSRQNLSCPEDPHAEKSYPTLDAKAVRKIETQQLKSLKISAVERVLYRHLRCRFLAWVKEYEKQYSDPIRIHDEDQWKQIFDLYFEKYSKNSALSRSSAGDFLKQEMKIGGVGVLRHQATGFLMASFDFEKDPSLRNFPKEERAIDGKIPEGSDGFISTPYEKALFYEYGRANVNALKNIAELYLKLGYEFCDEKSDL